MSDTFEEGTLIPRGKYIRECNIAMKNKQYFANCADKERDLRLQLREPKNWLSLYFSKEPVRSDIYELMNELVDHLTKMGLDTSELDDWIHVELKEP